jgi:hypothetical protein
LAKGIDRRVRRQETGRRLYQHHSYFHPDLLDARALLALFFVWVLVCLPYFYMAMQAKQILKYPFFILLASILFCSCKKNEGNNNPPLFDSVTQVHAIIPVLNEVSGIADSRQNPGYLWGEEDSGNPSDIFLISHTGQVSKSIHLEGITNRDWEDMAYFGGDLYLAETGDNNLAETDYRFYHFPEPSAATDTVHNIATIHFKYPDGAHDAEAFIVDPVTKDIYVITKRDNPSRIYKISFPFGADNTAVLAGNLPFTGVVSATLSEDGKECIVKTYNNLYYYTIAPGNSIPQILMHTYIPLPYHIEPQGEAVCFAADGSGFYTLSEKGFSSSVNLYFYKRN